MNSDADSEGKLAFRRDGLSTRFVDARSAQARAALSLRDRARVLRSEVSAGHYLDQHLAEFWSIVEVANITLMESNSELAERAGLGANYFVTVTRERRRPKFANMLRALSAVIEAADDRLTDIDIDIDIDVNDDEIDLSWISNPLFVDRVRLERLEGELRELIEYLSQTNLLFEPESLDKYWKANLINTLETVLALLKAPLLERSMFKRAADGLSGAASKIALSTTSAFFGALAGSTATELINLIGHVK